MRVPAVGPIARSRTDYSTIRGAALSFQSLILDLQRFWADQGCVILQPYDIEVGAGTFHPATALRALGPEPWRAVYVQPSRRPTDGRYGVDCRFPRGNQLPSLATSRTGSRRACSGQNSGCDGSQHYLTPFWGYR